MPKTEPPAQKSQEDEAREKERGRKRTEANERGGGSEEHLRETGPAKGGEPAKKKRKKKERRGKGAKEDRNRSSLHHDT